MADNDRVRLWHLIHRRDIKMKSTYDGIVYALYRQFFNNANVLRQMTWYNNVSTDEYDFQLSPYFSQILR